MKIEVRRGGGWPGWNVYRDGFVVALCGDNKQRAQAVARDLRAACPVLEWRPVRPKYL